MNLLVLFRWVHILAGLAWVGEVITINVVIIPALKSLPDQEKPGFINAVFPRVFSLATVLALLSISAGSLHLVSITGWKLFSEGVSTAWMIGIYGGALLAFLLVFFHLVLERRLKPLVSEAGEASVERIVHLLGIIPRVGLGVIITISLLMFYGASAG